MRLGARIVKTGVAIVLALFLAELLHLPHPLFAGIAAIFAIQPSIYRSYLTIIEQVQSNLIGATVAILFVLVFGPNLISVGLAAIFIIVVMLRLNLGKSVSLALVVMIAIMEISHENFLEFAFLRLITMLLGILAAFAVNLLFLPPKYETKLFQSIHQAQDEIIRWTRLAGRQASEHTATKKSVKKLEERLTEIDQLYLLFKEERSYLKKTTRSKGRTLVLYRQMIATSRSSLEVLRRLHRYENELLELPEHFRMMIQERLDTLLTHHEQLHLKFIGKLKQEWTGQPLDDEYVQRHEVMEIFIKEITITREEEEFSAYHLLHVLSAILNYDEQLEHLDRLIVSFHKYHKNEIGVKIHDEII